MKIWTLRSPAPGVAFSVHLGALGVIVLGQFPAAQLAAVRAHEEAHLLEGHGWTILLARMRGRLNVPELRRQFELDADAHAVRAGHGDGMLAFLWTHRAIPESPDYPSRLERIANVIKVARGI